MTVPNFAQITRQYGPAVVNISVSGTKKVALQQEPFAQFFGGMPGFPRHAGADGPRPPVKCRSAEKARASLSSPDGVILTNAPRRRRRQRSHRQADRPPRVPAPRSWAATPVTDVAVIKIDASHLPVVRLGNGERPERRRLGAGHRLALWPGKYGDRRHRQREGPLAARRYVGTVHPDRRRRQPRQLRRAAVQLRAAKWWASTRRSTARTGGYQGLSFAIPIDVAIRIKDEIVAHGKGAPRRWA